MTTKKTKKNTKSKSPHRGPAQTNAGSLFPVLNVTDMHSAKNAVDMASIGPVIFIFFAKWCGHCREFMPQANRAANDGSRTVNVAMVEDNHIDKVNEAFKEKNGKETTFTIGSFPTIQGVEPSIVSPNNSATPKEIPRAAFEESLRLTPNKSVQAPPPALVVGKKGVAASMENLPKSATQLDMGETQNQGEGPKGPGAVIGGSLVSAMSQTAYTLAPTAVLLATAAAIMKGTRKGTRKRTLRKRTLRKRALRKRTLRKRALRKR